MELYTTVTPKPDPLTFAMLQYGDVFAFTHTPERVYIKINDDTCPSLDDLAMGRKANSIATQNAKVLRYDAVVSVVR